MAREVGLTVQVARSQRGLGLWLLGGALIAVPVAVVLAGAGVIGGLVAFGKWLGAAAGWVGAVVVTVVAVRTFAGGVR